MLNILLEMFKQDQTEKYKKKYTPNINPMVVMLN